MLPHRFAYHRPQAVPEAVELLERFGDDASPYAGGTELLLAMKARVLRYEHLIDLKRIPDLSTIFDDEGMLVIGALASHFETARNPLVRTIVPAFAQLANNIANIRVRVTGTLGGNLCFAEPHADPPALLCALGASVRLAGPRGMRDCAVADFITSEFTTDRQIAEIMTAIRIPKPPLGGRYAYRNFGHLERPAVGIAAAALPGGRYRVWCGAIGGQPIQLRAIEEAIAGVPPAELEDVLPEAAQEAAGSLDAKDDLHGSADFKRHIASVLTMRVVRDVTTEVAP